MMTTLNEVESMLTNWNGDYVFRWLLSADKCDEAGETELAKIIRWYVSSIDPSKPPPILVDRKIDTVTPSRYFVGYLFKSDGQVADTMIELLIKLEKQELHRVFNRTLENTEYVQFWRSMGLEVFR